MAAFALQSEIARPDCEGEAQRSIAFRGNTSELLPRHINSAAGYEIRGNGLDAIISILQPADC